MGSCVLLSRRAVLGLAALAAAACRAGRTRAGSGAAFERDADVIVVGAGLAGLAAAERLVAAGRSVVVLEAQARCGGRVHTLRGPFAHGQYAEAGAAYVPREHDVTRRYVASCGLELVPAFAPGTAAGLYLRGELYARGFREPALALRDDERGAGRRGLFARYVLAAVEELGPAAVSLDPGSPASAEARRLDALSFADLLRERGASDAAVELLGLGYLGVLGDGVGTVSALQVLRDLAQAGGTPGAERIAGGSALLPEALAAALAPVLVSGARVRAIEQDERGVRVAFERSGETRTLTAGRAIVTLPTTVLRELDLALSPATLRALATVGSTSVTRTFLQYEDRPWRELASIDTDLDCGGLKDATAGQPGPAGILESYATGAAARRLDALPERERLARVRLDIERVLPGSTASWSRGASWSWDADPFARGGYAWFRPGELTAHLAALRGPDGRVHLAGEHTSRWSGWMQGALESGERAAEEALAAGA